MTAGARRCSRFGSLNSWKLPMTENTRVSMSAGRSAGSLIDQAIRHGAGAVDRRRLVELVRYGAQCGVRMIML